MGSYMPGWLAGCLADEVQAISIEFLKSL